MEPLTIDRAVALQAEFMNRLAERLADTEEFVDPASGRRFSGSARQDDEYPADFVRELERAQTASGRYGEALRERMPTGARARWEVKPGGLLRFGVEMVVIGAVLQPFRELLSGLTPSGRDANDLAGVARDVDEEGPPMLVAALSPSGWRGEPEPPAVDRDTVLRFEPAEGGGFRRYPDAMDWPPAFVALESEQELMTRVLLLVAKGRVELVLRGLSAKDLSRQAGIPPDIVARGFERAVREGELLRLSHDGDDVVLRRA